MKLILTLTVLLFSAGGMAQTYRCENHPQWPEHRKFSAEIDLFQPQKQSKNQQLEARLSKLILSDPWPLPEQCESPFDKNNQKLNVRVRGNKITLWLPQGKECGFMFFIETDSDSTSLLSPKKTTDQFVEEPFLATCRVI